MTQVIHRRRPLFLAGAFASLALAVVIAACGGDGDSDNDPTPTPGNSATATAQAIENPPGNGGEPPNGDPTLPPGNRPTVAPTNTPTLSDVRLLADGCAADCAFALNQSFTLSVDIVNAPTPGYIGAQSLIDFGTFLTYNSSERQAADEILWADCADDVALRSQDLGTTTVAHGCLTGLIPPLPVSNATGPFVEITLTCSAEPTTTVVRAIPQGDPVALTSGTAFAEAPDGYPQSVPSTSNLTVSCG